MVYGTRGRVVLVGTTFLAVTAGMYALYIVGLYAAVDYIGGLAWIRLAVAAVALLGERMGVRRWLATAVGFLGVLVILRPGFQMLSLGLLAALASALLWGGTGL